MHSIEGPSEMSFARGFGNGSPQVGKEGSSLEHISGVTIDPVSTDVDVDVDVVDVCCVVCVVGSLFLSLFVVVVVVDCTEGLVPIESLVLVWLFTVETSLSKRMLKLIKATKKSAMPNRVPNTESHFFCSRTTFIIFVFLSFL